MAPCYRRGSAACSFLMLQSLLLLPMARLWLPRSRCEREGRQGSSEPPSPRAPIQQAAVLIVLAEKEQVSPDTGGTSQFRWSECVSLQHCLLGWFGDACAASWGVLVSNSCSKHCSLDFLTLFLFFTEREFLPFFKKKNLLIWKGWVFQKYLHSLAHCSGPLTPGDGLQTPSAAQGLPSLWAQKIRVVKHS